MIKRFYILGSEKARPSSRKTIFVDGSPDETYREGIDMELSHWIPNRTPIRFKADTSTEICMNFITEDSSDEWDLAINNHLDVDGILSVFVLVHSDFALKHRKVIVEAAEMGDFWAWGSREAQRLFQGLTLYMNDLRKEKTDILTVYELCFERVFDLIQTDNTDERMEKGLRALELSYRRVEKGEIKREPVNSRFVHYHLPAEFTLQDLRRTLHVPAFNDPLSDEAWLLPNVRAYYDKEKVHLVSAAGEHGYYYDLWYPGYMWADTPNSWRAPGFVFNGSTNGYFYGYDPLERAVATLNEWELNEGEWILVKELSPFSGIQGRNYPIVLSFMKDCQPALSSLDPDRVVPLLAEVFKESQQHGQK